MPGKRRGTTMLVAWALAALLSACVGEGDVPTSPQATADLDTDLKEELQSPEPRDCSLANAFPPEEADLIWPTLHQAQPGRANPGDAVEIRGTGGFLYWDNECGEFKNESSRDFQLLFDDEPVGFITCYAYTCLADLTIPVGTAPGIHTVSVEGGSRLDIEIGRESLPSRTQEVQGLELVGYLGSGQARAVAARGDYAYVGIDIELAVVDITKPSRLQRVGRVFLPGPVMDVALVGDHAYVLTGRGAGLHVVDVSEPEAPAVRSSYYLGVYVSGMVAAGDYVYLSGNALHILDVSDPAAPIEVGTYAPVLGAPAERVVAARTDEPQGHTYAYTAYDRAPDYGFRILDVSAPAAPALLGSLATSGPIYHASVASDHAYLLVGPGFGRLVIVDVSDPRNPTEVNPVLPTPWRSRCLAVVDQALYLTDVEFPDSSSVGALQMLDITEPTRPAALGRYAGLTPETLDVAITAQRAYVAVGDGLAVLDVSDPTAPKDAGLYYSQALPGTGSDVAVEGNTVYVAAGEAGLQVVDASDPAKPRVVGSQDTAGHSWAIALSEADLKGHRYAYVADEYNGLRVIDISDPLAPVETGAYDLPGQYEFFHGLALAEADSQGHTYAYVADGGLMDTGLRVVDVSDPAHPFGIAFLPLPAGAGDSPMPRVEDVVLADGYVYLAAGTAGLRVVDVSDPVAPVEVGFYDTPGRTDHLAVAGSYVYMIDGDLRIVDVSNPTAPAEVGFYNLPDLAILPHVAVQGRHAYLTGNGLQILDISDPGALVEVAQHPMPVGDVAVAGEAVFVIGDGLFILQSLAHAR